jgi:hypothetical protein
MSDEDLTKKVTEYQKLAQENPNVNVSMLMMNALETSNKVRQHSYRWGYMIAVGLPPFGLLVAIKYWMSGEDDDRQAAKICILLTAISVIMFFAFGKLFFSSAGVSPQQIEQIKPADIQQVLQ